MSQVLFVPPLAWDGAAPGRCYDNVLAMIRRHGGQAVFGWAVAEYGPLHVGGGQQLPLYRAWFNHVVWCDPSGNLWEVSPSRHNRNHALAFTGVGFLPDPQAGFLVDSQQDWHTSPPRYEPLREEGRPVADCLNRALAAQDAAGRTDCLASAYRALQEAGYSPREVRLELANDQSLQIDCLVD
jgi:hypothetical protein